MKDLLKTTLHVISEIDLRVLPKPVAINVGAVKQLLDEKISDLEAQEKTKDDVKKQLEKKAAKKATKKKAAKKKVSKKK